MYRKKTINSKFKIDTSDKGKLKRTFNGVLYDSEMEMKFHKDYLVPLLKKGNIKTITLQPKYILQDKFKKYGKSILPINYVADFEVEWLNGLTIVYDVKGLPTPEAKMKRKMFDFRYPDKVLQWIALSNIDGGWIQYDDLVKARAKRKKEKNSIK